MHSSVEGPTLAPATGKTVPKRHASWAESHAEDTVNATTVPPVSGPAAGEMSVTSSSGWKEKGSPTTVAAEARAAGPPECAGVSHRASIEETCTQCASSPPNEHSAPRLVDSSTPVTVTTVPPPAVPAVGCTAATDGA